MRPGGATNNSNQSTKVVIDWLLASSAPKEMNERLRGFTFFGVELELPFGGALARRLLFRLWRKPQRWVMGGAMATIQLNQLP